MHKHSILRRGKSKSPVADSSGVSRRLRAQNKKLLQWLDSWFATPDERGEALWIEFELGREKRRVTFNRGETG
jgi:hypothetical protein